MVSPISNTDTWIKIIISIIIIIVIVRVVCELI